MGEVTILALSLAVLALLIDAWQHRKSARISLESLQAERALRVRTENLYNVAISERDELLRQKQLLTQTSPRAQDTPGRTFRGSELRRLNERYNSEMLEAERPAGMENHG